MRIADDDPYNIECLISARVIGVDTVAQASSQACGRSGIPRPRTRPPGLRPGGLVRAVAAPEPVPGLSGNVAWIPAQNELLATNGTESLGGTYVTGTVTPPLTQGSVEHRGGDRGHARAPRLRPASPNGVAPN